MDAARGRGPDRVDQPDPHGLDLLAPATRTTSRSRCTRTTGRSWPPARCVRQAWNGGAVRSGKCTHRRHRAGRWRAAHVAELTLVRRGGTGCDNRPVLPRLEIVRRLRPVDLVSPAAGRTASGGSHPLPALAPYVAATTILASPTSSAHLALHLDETRLGVAYDGSTVSLVVTRGGDTREHRSRRMGTAESPTGLGLTLTGTHVTAWCREQGRWVARARHGPARRPRRPRPARRGGAGRPAGRAAAVAGGTAGGFGQLGLRDTPASSPARTAARSATTAPCG